MSKKRFKAVDNFHDGIKFTMYQRHTQYLLRREVTRTLKDEFNISPYSTDCVAHVHTKTHERADVNCGTLVEHGEYSVIRAIQFH